MPKATAAQRASVDKKRRSRRSTEEIIALLLDAACDEFELNGYDGAKTATIAGKAGVTEALIFSNFGSKSQLFHDSIFKPLEQHFVRFQTAHLYDDNDAAGVRQGTLQYILELQKFIARHSRMLKSVVAAQMYANESLQDLRQVQGLHAYFSRAANEATGRLADDPKIQPELLTRVSFATVLACVLFKDWLFPKALASPLEISSAISDFVLDGLNANGDAQAEAQPGAQRATRSRRAPAAARSAKKR
jgi:AcrR family transcriptional regulator